jgi:hypothetical protein
MVEEKDVCLVEFIGNVDKVEENCGTPPTFIVLNLLVMLTRLKKIVEHHQLLLC